MGTVLVKITKSFRCLQFFSKYVVHAIHFKKIRQCFLRDQSGGGGGVLKFYPKILTQGMIMDSFTKFDYVFEYEYSFSLIATLFNVILAYSELFIHFLARIK